MIQPGRANLHRSFPKHPFSLREFLPNSFSLQITRFQKCRANVTILKTVLRSWYK